MNLFEKPTVLYDGYCTFCINLCDYLKKFLGADDFNYISFRDLTLSDWDSVYPHLTLSICEREIQFFINGQRYPGFFGLRKALLVHPNLKLWGYLLFLPLVPYLGMFVFYAIGKWRIFNFNKSRIEN